MEDIDPATWGGDAWRFLHTLARAYPVTPDGQTRRAMYHLLSSLETLLPCTQCRQHFRDQMRSTGLRSSESGPLLSRKALEKWLDAAHRHANSHRDVRLGKETAAETGGTAVAAGGAVAPAAVPAGLPQRQPTGLTRGPAPPPASGQYRTTALTRADVTRRTALIGCFSVIAIVLVAVFVAYVAVTARDRGFSRVRVVRRAR